MNMELGTYMVLENNLKGPFAEFTKKGTNFLASKNCYLFDDQQTGKPASLKIHKLSSHVTANWAS